jgi:fumarate reductase subunit D
VYNILGSYTNARCIFCSKNIIRIVLGVSPRCSCIDLFKKLDILAFPCLYVFSLMLFVLNNFNNFHTNSRVREINTRYKKQLHRPVVNLSCYQIGVYYSGIRMFNILPSIISDIKKDKSRFRAALRSCLV